jgi:hypothetical protein
MNFREKLFKALSTNFQDEHSPKSLTEGYWKISQWKKDITDCNYEFEYLTYLQVWKKMFNVFFFMGNYLSRQHIVVT